MTFILVLLIGVVAGTFGAMFGIGGGIFLIPVLVVGIGLPMHQAVATSIIAVIATSSSSAAMYVDKGMTNIRLGMSLEVMTTIGALLGSLLANELAGDVLRKFFAVFLLVMGSIMWWRTYKHGGSDIRFDPAASISGCYVDAYDGSTVRYSVRRLPVSMTVSFIAGNISGLLGVGGGIIKVPVMNMISGVPMKAATATSNFMIGVTAVTGAFVFLAHGNVNPAVTAASVMGVLGGTRIGASLAAKIHSRTLTILFILLIFATAIRMFF
jgi:uncharacterized membrane protein YfcA